MERVSPKSKNGGGLYHSQPASDLDFIASGCQVLDLAVSGERYHLKGGAYPLGRVVNLIGDSSTGKTLLAIEAAANFAERYKGKIWYREAESAFDQGYAGALGMPLKRVDFGKRGMFRTVDDIFEDIKKCVAETNRTKHPGLYIIDSLDALSSRAEMAHKKLGEGFGTGKAKDMSEMFRRITQDVEASRMCLIVISQVRDNIVMFGDKFSVSGGKALKFYASLRIMLSQRKVVKKTVGGIERTVGIRVRAKCIKNKIGPPFRECEFVIRFGYGIDDYRAGLEWLIDNKHSDAIGVSKIKVADLLDDSWDWDGPTYRKHNSELALIVPKVWNEIESRFNAPHRKYGAG